MLEVITSVTDKPTNAHAYCVERLPRLRTTPPAIANKTLGQLSCINNSKNHLSWMKKKQQGEPESNKISILSPKTKLFSLHKVLHTRGIPLNRFQWLLY